ncbi:MAG: D-alanyl-D-alanine carboxypeptidase [Candidatus Omnitrophica bacterium]|nr:D-alanyl-D-alanine carboxypeptidase [Candidatus Omnitrophota bacterium]
MLQNMSLKIYKIGIFVLCCCCLAVVSADARRHKKIRYTKIKNGVTCKAALFSDSTESLRLYGKNVETPILPASTTKLMTALLVLEKLPMDSYVTVSSYATTPQPSKINVKAGEQFLVRDLMYAILLNSANDASIVLAEAVGGSEAGFVSMMNNRAAELGADQTRFANSNGLPSPRGTQYSTAYDMYLIFREAMKYPFFRQVIKTPYKQIQSKEGRIVNLKSHNKMLFDKNLDEPIQGKTGYTRSAGECFVGTVQQGDRDLILSIFNCPDRWNDIRYLVKNYGK